MPSKISKCQPQCYCALLFNALLGISFLCWASVEYIDRKENPSQYSYTTCFIRNIRAYTEEGEDHSFDYQDIYFSYGLSNEDWDQTGKYKSTGGWNKGKVGQIGTCIYTPNGRDTLHTHLTLNNFLIHFETSAHWLLLDEKFLWIDFIILCVVCLSMTAGFGVFWWNRADQSQNNTDYCKSIDTVSLELQWGCVWCSAIWVVACVVTAWPTMIMSSMVYAGLNGPLNERATRDDVYDAVDCRIENIEDTVYYTSWKEVSFALVKYDVFTEYGNMVAVDMVSDAESETSVEYLDLATWQTCYQNNDTQQIILSEPPTVHWLRPPANPWHRNPAFHPLWMSCLVIFAACLLYSIIKNKIKKIKKLIS